MTTATAVAMPEATVLMTEEEARTCVSWINANLEETRTLLLDLYERDGWRVLGYASWRDCVTAELGQSVATVYKQLTAAKVDRVISHDENEPMPLAHALELAPLLPEPEALRSVAEKVRERKGSSATTADYHAGVDEHFGRKTKPRSGKPSTRRTSDPDISQDVPDDVVLGTNEVPNDGTERTADEFGDVVNNEPQIGPKRTSWCQDCGERYSGEICTCKSADQTEDDGAVESTGSGAAVAGDEQRSSGAAHSGQQSASRGGTTRGQQQTYSRPVHSGPPPLTIRGNAGDAMRAIADRYALDRLAEGIGEAYSDTERGSLTAQLFDSLPAHEKERVAHRVGVAVKTNDDASPPASASLGAWADAAKTCLTPGSRIGLLKLVLDGLDAEQQQRFWGMYPERGAGSLPSLTDLEQIAAALPPGQLLGLSTRIAKQLPLADFQKLAAFVTARLSRLEGAQAPAQLSKAS